MRNRRHFITSSRKVWSKAAAASGFGIAASICVLFFMVFTGCTQDAKTTKNVMLEEPKVTNGLILEGEDPNKFKKLAAALDAMDFGVSKASPATSANILQADAGKPAQVSAAEAVEMAGGSGATKDTTTLITMPKLSTMEIAEISENLVLHLESELGYIAAPDIVADALPAPPARVTGGGTLSRSVEGGTAVLRFGCLHFVSQPPKLWIMGVVVSQDGKLSANPDLKAVEPQVTKLVTALNEIRGNLTVRDLEAKLIQLSYVDADAALSMLQGMGVTTMNKPTELPSKVEFAKLPYVVKIEDPKKEYTGLVGKETQVAERGSKLSLTPGVASEMSDNAIASPTNQLLVLFHRAHPEQFSEVRRILDDLIDRPARQIFIDAMVLEISEQGLRDLGIDWKLKTPNAAGISMLVAGSQNAGSSDNTLDLIIDDTADLSELFESQMDWDWTVTLRALIRTGKAEILSRPSVLTLNNRQSTIRVGQDIPIASSLQGSFGGKISFAFDYLPVGILLNIRPRINETGAEVSMLIDTIVSAEVPGEDLVLTDPDEEIILASAPTVSTRRVQTYGRIPNNTPLIIGGLVSRDMTLTMDKVPIVGDIPILGILFRAEKRESLKREVIIVLTPHVLPDERIARRSLPKDEDAFDSFGNELFRDSYRIRSEDVFDLTFLQENQRIVSYRTMARQVAQKNFRIGAVEPFRAFVRDDIPGESILVTRMIYEVIKRLNIADKIEQSRIIYFKSSTVSGYDVEWLEGLVAKKNGKLKDFGDKALAIEYDYDRDSLEAGRLGTEPIPHIRLIDCPDRDVWKEKLWELNQPTPDGQKRHTILIQNEDDVVRLRRALALKRIAVLNGGTEYMRLRNFSVGKILLMPELKKGQVHVIDADTARFFFHTELYYAATLAEIEKQLKDLDKMLRRPEINVLLESGPLAGKPAGNGDGAEGE